uniref:Uncharacterized protein n=1 Tax=Guillardia theta TaxID=55529 RepID=A0A7S4M038_GUITH|mmetsp:Transcript_12063/g.41942  ORF Transcript_12063/g.41942 Transcript_12063/m.41942 type:complete len:634 (+) Transcript_12063:38-1939(+)
MPAAAAVREEGGLDLPPWHRPPPAMQRDRFPRPSPSIDSNPYEGALGPAVVEGGIMSKTHARSDVSTLIKTPQEVWRVGKQPTIPADRPLPGVHSETRASQRVPSYKRGNANASRVVASNFERLPDTFTIKSTTAIWQKTMIDVQGGQSTMVDSVYIKPTKNTSLPALGSHDETRQESISPVRSRSATGYSEMDSSVGRRRESKNEVERAESNLIQLKAHLNRLQQAVQDREAELTRLLSARSRVERDEAKISESEREFEEFRRRVEARVALYEGRCQDLARQRQVLEEVLKRMRSAHKEKNQRLGQVREDVRLLNIQIEESSQELQNLLRTRDQTVEGLHAMKATIEEENSKWMLEIARRQEKAERLLAETKALAEKMKKNKLLQEQLQADNEAMKELARRRAIERRTSYKEEYDKLLEQKRRPDAEVPWLDPRIEEGINRILDAAGASDIQDAIQFFHQMKDRRKGLEILQEDLERRKRKYIQDFTSTVTVSYEPVQDASVREFEMSIQDIEQHAAQADALNEAMRELIGSAYGWLKDQLRRIVMIMEEESAIREIHALIKRMPRIGEEERLILWMVDALRAIQVSLPIPCLLASSFPCNRKSRRLPSAILDPLATRSERQHREQTLQERQ